MALVSMTLLCLFSEETLAGSYAYTVTDLGTLGGTFSQAYGINNSGQVVGCATTSDNTNSAIHAFLYFDGTMTDLGTLGGTNSYATGITTSGTIVGYSLISGNAYYHPFLYNSSGPMQDLGTLNARQDIAVGINDSGQVVGSPRYAVSGSGIGGTGPAFLYSGTGPMQNLDTLTGSPWLLVNSINDNGQIVGYGQIVGTSGYTACLYSGGTMQYLGSLGGNSSATSINNAGKIVGYSNVTAYSDFHAVEYTGSGPMRDLGTLGGSQSWATDVNSSGQIVGWSTTGKGGGVRAFIIGGSGVMEDLGSLIDPSSGFVPGVATAINDKGQIVGYGTNPAGQTHAFLLTPLLSILPPVPAEHHDERMRGSASWNTLAQGDSEYDIEFTSSQELRVTVDVRLTGDNPVGPNGEDLRQIWEEGIENTWNGQYEVTYGSLRYPIVLDVNWVTGNEDVSVRVHSGSGGVDSLNFYTDDPSGWGFLNQGLVAAHETGHWLGLYDEYNPQNNEDPAWWPLYDSQEALDPYLDFNDLWVNVLGVPLLPRPDWQTLSAGADEGGLMGELGGMRDRYYLPFLEWFNGETDLDFVLGQAPTFTDREGLGGPADADPPETVPEPPALILLSLAILAVNRHKRC